MQKTACWSLVHCTGNSVFGYTCRARPCASRFLAFPRGEAVEEFDVLALAAFVPVCAVLAPASFLALLLCRCREVCRRLRATACCTLQFVVALHACFTEMCAALVLQSRLGEGILCVPFSAARAAIRRAGVLELCKACFAVSINLVLPLVFCRTRP